MSPREKIQCECGGVLTRPLPRVCPHCGGEIVSVKRASWPAALSAVIVLLMLAALVAALLFFVQK